MVDKNFVRVETNRLAARLGCFFKNVRGDEAAWCAATVEFFNVLQTARRARTSVSQAFYDNITFARDLLQ